MDIDFTVQVRKTITKYDMLQAGAAVLAGVSGGADSVALLRVLLELKEEYDLEIAAMHLNHGLRGEESDRDERFTAELCDKLGVECVCGHADVKRLAKEKGLSTEEAGREARYAFFERERARRGEHAVVAVAHTLDDSAETALLNLARGSAMRGLCGIPPVRENLIRPLIECERKDVEAYLAGLGQEYVNDSSNDGDGYARNRVRHGAVPVLLSVNPAYLRAALRSMDALRADADYLDKLAAGELERIKLPDGESFDRQAFLELSAPLRMRILLALLLRRDIPADSARLARLDDLITAGSGAEQLSGSLRFYVSKKRFRIEAEPVILDKKLRLVYMNDENCEENMKSREKLLNNALDCDKIVGILFERKRLPGDRLRPVGRGCTKTIKNLCQEAGVPAAARSRLPVLADDLGPVWVLGFGADERTAADSTTKRAVVVEIIEE